MKVKVNLNKLIMLDKNIDIISEQIEGEITYQGLPIYEVESITGVVVYDKEEFIKLCLEATKKAYDKLIFDVELVFVTNTKVPCNNDIYWVLDVTGEPKEDEDGNIYFDKFEVVEEWKNE